MGTDGRIKRDRLGVAVLVWLFEVAQWRDYKSSSWILVYGTGSYILLAKARGMASFASLMAYMSMSVGSVVAVVQEALNFVKVKVSLSPAESIVYLKVLAGEI